VEGTAWLAAGGADAALPTLVVDIALSLVFAGVLAIAFTRLRIPTVAAFLLAGVILGPVGTGLITDRGNIETIAQLGLILLLFLIGLEIDLRSLLASGRTVLTSGGLQYPLTALFGFVVVQALLLVGVSAGVLSGSYAALYIGLAVAASSTLLVVALFQQSFTLDTLAGRIALALLVFQDIWAIVVLALQPNLDDPAPGPIIASFVGIALMGVMSFLLARAVLPVGFEWIAKQPATILVASLAWCFFVVLVGINLDTYLAYFSGMEFGVAVSAGMGALIAGVTIASLPFSAEIVRQVSVVRDFFVTLFFVGIGMTIPAPDGAAVVLGAFGLAALAILSRYLVMLPLLYVTGLDRRTSTVVSTKLAQISEFSLVIAFLGLQLGHIDEDLNAIIVFAFVLTAVLTPTLFAKADAVHDRLAPLLGRLGFKAPPEDSGAEDEHYELALLGVHRTASSLLHELAVNTPELLDRTLVVDFNVSIHSKIADLGPHVVYGDMTSPETLRHAGVDKARVVVCTIPGEMLASATTQGVVGTVRELCPNGTVIATATTFPEARTLYDAGADFVLMPRLDAARTALGAIEAALNGEIAALRSQSEPVVGEQPRREVLD
jgi:Kef-type K+ transport system membrane component KefB